VQPRETRNRPATQPGRAGRTRGSSAGYLRNEHAQVGAGLLSVFSRNGKVTVRLYRAFRLTESWRGKRQAGIRTWSCLPLLTDGGVHCAHCPPTPKESHVEAVDSVLSASQIACWDEGQVAPIGRDAHDHYRALVPFIGAGKVVRHRRLRMAALGLPEPGVSAPSCSLPIASNPESRAKLFDV